MFQQFELQK